MNHHLRTVTVAASYQLVNTTLSRLQVQLLSQYLIYRELQGLNTMLLGKDSVVKGLQDEIGSLLERDFNKVKVEELLNI